MKKAIITGISGQDGYFLTKLLMEKGYEVHGIVRRNSQMDKGNIVHLTPEEQSRLIIHWGDITDHTFIDHTVETVKPDELYHLAAQSFVGFSFTNPKFTYDVNISGTLNIANGVKEYSPSTRVYFAATSELYGKARTTPQNEETPFYPRSPYGVSKLAGFWTMKNYRESYNLFFTNGILFNHESEMRGAEFVTRKITIGVSRIKYGLQEVLNMGNIDARRDWGYAKDYVYGMWLMLQQEKPDDFVLATGENHSVREFIEEAFRFIGTEIVWEGSGENEKGYDKHSGKLRISIDPGLYRPAEVDQLLGDATKARTKLGWKPEVTFKQLVQIMMEHDLKMQKPK